MNALPQCGLRQCGPHRAARNADVTGRRIVQPRLGWRDNSRSGRSGLPGEVTAPTNAIIDLAEVMRKSPVRAGEHGCRNPAGRGRMGGAAGGRGYAGSRARRCAAGLAAGVRAGVLQHRGVVRPVRSPFGRAAFPAAPPDEQHRRDAGDGEHRKRCCLAELVGDPSGERRADRTADADREPDGAERQVKVSGPPGDVAHDERHEDAEARRRDAVERLEQDDQGRIVIARGARPGSGGSRSRGAARACARGRGPADQGAISATITCGRTIQAAISGWRRCRRWR